MSVAGAPNAAALAGRTATAILLPSGFWGVECSWSQCEDRLALRVDAYLLKLAPGLRDRLRLRDDLVRGALGGEDRCRVVLLAAGE